ncbi:alanine--tRNA ligase, partial [Thermanaerothrix sp.]|uniref:alanine--tRNA ligase n=1 Tax=Thermanaerothrix sp. TaxID=2972675 RepID=UPI003C7B24A1
AENWAKQPGMDSAHILFFGRKDNFWEMAETGPCGPCSEIHIDLGPEFCDKRDVPGHVCRVNGDCKRFLELWNLVFIQYNRLNPTRLEPLPARHVDTGMGLERITAILQGVSSNYATDLLSPLLDKVQQLTGHTLEERKANITPYRVIADHSRAATFLIADGVVPGNVGRNYVCRMIIRRAARFGRKIGLMDPFLANVADTVIEIYGEAYPELVKNKDVIRENLTREEIRFRRTVEQGLSQLDVYLEDLKARGEKILDGERAFDLYATHGLPLELIRDVAQEEGLDVDQEGFLRAMEAHRTISGAGKAFGPLGGERVDIYRSILEDLQRRGALGPEGVIYDPYSSLEVEGQVLALVRDGERVEEAIAGDAIEVILPRTCFYVEAGGQVSDTGRIIGLEGADWEIRVNDTRKPAAGVIVHIGEVVRGRPRVGDIARAQVDVERRRDIMRNHTATHLLHAKLQAILGKEARQAGSLVAPDRLRFDFTYPEALTPEQLEAIEAAVNQAIYEDYELEIEHKPLSQALQEGAMALFGEKYGEVVRTIVIGDEQPISYELCGGTHVESTGDIGIFIITSESSAAAGIRRIEAVTGREAYALIRKRMNDLSRIAEVLNCGVDEVPDKVVALVEDVERLRKQNAQLRQKVAMAEFEPLLHNVQMVDGIRVLTAIINEADADVLRQLCDRFRQQYREKGVAVLATASEGRPIIVATLTDDLVKQGFHAGELAKEVAQVVGGSGGGRPHLAQAGGKDASMLSTALNRVLPWVKQRLSQR